MTTMIVQGEAVPIEDTICACGHWFGEHENEGGECYGCQVGGVHECHGFEFDEKESTAGAIADRGGDPDLWPEHVKRRVDRARKRELIAHQIVSERFSGDDDVSIEPPDEEIEYVDGGYWVSARLFVYADDVEERMNA